MEVKFHTIEIPLKGLKYLVRKKNHSYPYSIWEIWLSMIFLCPIN